MSAVIGTRPELLPILLKEVSPVLISRFGDRETSVKSEVWSTYVLLLNQTAVYSGQRGGEGDHSGLKRKRDHEDSMDEDGSPLVLLRTQVPLLSKQLFGQLRGSKAPPNILQGGFAVLSALLRVLPGVLSGQTGSLFVICEGILAQSVSTATASLHISALQFLALFFQTHPPTTFANSLGTITPSLISSVGQRHPRVTSESLRVFSALLVSLRPVKSAPWLDEVYRYAVARMKTNDTDGEVRQSAEECVGEMWVSAPDFVRSKDGTEWDYILRSSERTESPINVVTHVAKQGEITDEWVNKCIYWIVGILKRSGRVGKADAFACLEVLLRR